MNHSLYMKFIREGVENVPVVSGRHSPGVNKTALPQLYKSTLRKSANIEHLHLSETPFKYT